MGRSEIHLAERIRGKPLSVPDWGPALIAQKSELIAKEIPEAWLLKQEVVPAVLVL